MACLQTLRGLAKPCNLSNSGGIKKVYIANYEDVASVTADENGVITEITMTEGAKFYSYWFRKNTGSLTQTFTANENGSNYVTSVLTLVFDRMESVKRMQVQALAQGELAVIVEDVNGERYFLGEDAPVTKTEGVGATGTARTDKNSYDVTLSADSNEYPKFVSMDISTIVEEVVA